MAVNDTDQLYLDTNTKINLNKILEADLARNGMSQEDIALQSQTGLLIAGFNTIYDNVANIMNNIKRESSLTTAMYNSSLYNQLVQYETEITLSQPARLRMFIKIPVDQIKDRGKLVQANTYELKYTNQNIVEIDGQEFIPEVDTHYIRYTTNTNAYDLRVFRRDADGMTVNIPTQSLHFGGVRYLVFAADFIQLIVESQERTFADSQLDMFIVTTKNPIYDFKLYYKDNQAEDEIEISKRLFYTRGQGSFMQYKILANNSLRIEHKYVIGGFKPTVGGILRIELYTTTGENVKYRGAAINKVVSPLDLRVEYLPITDDVFESTGGRLSSNDKEYLRNYIIKLKGSRRRIDTEYDMGVWLKAYEGSSEFKPQLAINDTLARIFNIYTILSFNHQVGTETRFFTVPTNSGTLQVDLSRLPMKRIGGFPWYSINPKMAIKSAQSDTTTINTYDDSINTDTYKPPVSTNVFYYVSPFIYSYSESENFCRSYMDAQYSEPYESSVEFESNDTRITTRFINTTFRMEDYVGLNNKRVFRVVAQIRSDNPDFELNDEIFRAVLRLKKPGDTNEWVEIPAKWEVVNKEENKYNLIYDLDCDRIIADTYCDIKVKNVIHQISVTPEAQMDLYLKLVDETEVERPVEEIKVITYAAPLKIFKEVTATNNIQTNLDFTTGQMHFLMMPLVSLEFYQRPQNKQKIIDEVNSILNFLYQEIYTEYDMFAKNGVTLQDVQETLFTISLKFAKTYGRSKFLDVGAQKHERITNLQMSPTLYIRKLDEEFDESSISSQINKTFIQHDYEMIDLHMSDLVKEVLTEASDSVSILQFVNFDSYPDNYHMIERNDQPAKNDDPPEVVSLEPIWDEDAGTYKYNITYLNI